MADGRYSSFYMSDGALLALDFPDDDDFGVIPPFDDVISIPPELDPPKPDDDDTLPSKAHPSYPYGPPYSRAPSQFHHPNPYFPSTVASSSFLHPTWEDLALRDLLPHEMGKEVPPGMAGAKRGPQEDRSEYGDQEARAEEGGEEHNEHSSQSGVGGHSEEGEDDDGGTVGGSAMDDGEGRSWTGGEEEEEDEGEVRDLDDDVSGSEEGSSYISEDRNV